MSYEIATNFGSGRKVVTTPGTPVKITDESINCFMVLLSADLGNSSPADLNWDDVDKELAISSTFPSAGNENKPFSITIADSTTTDVQFAIKLFDYQSEFNTTTYTATIKESGIYTVKVNIRWNSAVDGARYDILVIKNGSTLLSAYETAKGTAFFRQALVEDISLSASDTIKIQVWHNSGVSVDIDAGYSSFSLVKIA